MEMRFLQEEQNAIKASFIAALSYVHSIEPDEPRIMPSGMSEID